MLSYDDMPGRARHLRGVQFMGSWLHRTAAAEFLTRWQKHWSPLPLFPGYRNCRAGLYQLREVLYLGQIVSHGFNEGAKPLEAPPEGVLPLRSPTPLTGSCQDVGRGRSKVIMAVHADGNSYRLSQLSDCNMWRSGS